MRLEGFDDGFEIQGGNAPLTGAAPIAPQRKSTLSASTASPAGQSVKVKKRRRKDAMSQGSTERASDGGAMSSMVRPMQDVSGEVELAAISPTISQRRRCWCRLSHAVCRMPRRKRMRWTTGLAHKREATAFWTNALVDWSRRSSSR